MKRIYRSMGMILAVSVLLASCAAGSGGPGPRTWIDAPLDGMHLPLGPVIVRSHAASDGGTAQAVLWINGVQVRVDQATDASSPLIEFAQTWIPVQPGLYDLQVITTDSAGNEGRSNSVRVQIGEVPANGTATPTLQNSTSPLPNSTPTATQPSGPLITLSQGANCREGDSTAYDVVTSFPAGQQIGIEGRNADNSWFWVPIGGGGHCWISASVGIPTGPYASTQIVSPPALAAPPVQPVASAPKAPGGFSVNTKTCSASEYIVNLQWNDTDGENGYQIYRDGGLIATLGAGATSFDDTSPDYNAHTYQVQAYNDAGTAGSATKNSEGCLY